MVTASPKVTPEARPYMVGEVHLSHHHQRAVRHEMNETDHHQQQGCDEDVLGPDKKGQNDDESGECAPNDGSQAKGVRQTSPDEVSDHACGKKYRSEPCLLQRWTDGAR